jgi:hypothetical protein
MNNLSSKQNPEEPEIAKSQVGRIGCWCETTKGGVSEGKGFVEVEPVMR